MIEAELFSLDAFEAAQTGEINRKNRNITSILLNIKHVSQRFANFFQHHIFSKSVKTKIIWIQEAISGKKNHPFCQNYIDICIFAAALSDGVMVAQQILVLFV